MGPRNTYTRKVCRILIDTSNPSFRINTSNLPQRSPNIQTNPYVATVKESDPTRPQALEHLGHDGRSAISKSPGDGVGRGYLITTEGARAFSLQPDKKEGFAEAKEDSGSEGRKPS